ncbi:nitronate monooxygenase [Spizellomyces sp. 'palustris']|nr:nitronate monooxygenase [Spizellomyces sp. 'palustris']
MVLRTELTSILGITNPIVLAPMAGVSHAALISAVANTGSLGLLGVGYATDAQWIHNQMRQASQAYKPESGGALGIGFITWWLEKNPALLEAALEWKPTALWFSFGNYGQFLETVRERSPDTKVIAQVQTVEEALEAVEMYGVDIIVAQGSEAGGHGAKVNASNFCLVPEINDAVGDRVPVVAAGGVTDGRHLAGASGVVLGTRFCATPESAMHPNAKDCLVASRDGGRSTVRTTVFDVLRGYSAWPSAYAFRVLCNDVTESIQSGTPIEEWKSKYEQALKAGNFNVAHVGAGQGVGLIKGIWPAKLVVERVMEEALECFQIAAAVSDPRRLRAKL